MNVGINGVSGWRREMDVLSAGRSQRRTVSAGKWPELLARTSLLTSPQG